MRIMHVSDSLTTGGKERMLVELANASAARGVAVSVCVTRSNLALAGELCKCIPIKVLNRRFTLDPKGFTRLAAFAGEQNPDLFHAHGRSSFSFLALAKFFGLISSPIILHDHCSDFHIPLWFRLWGKRLVSCYVGVCDPLAHWAESAGVNRERIVVIPNALDLSRFRNARPMNLENEFKSSGALIGVVVARIARQKGIDTLIKAVARLGDSKRVVFFVVGSIESQAYYEECQRLLLDHGLGDRFIFLGSQKAVASILKGADFAILPSLSESGPLVLIEYMACRLPFIVSCVGDVSTRVAKLGIPGFIPPGDVHALARALEELLSLSPEERRSRGKLGQEKALDLFDIRRAIPRWVELYSGILAHCENEPINYL